MATNDTTMTLTGVHSGLKIDVAGNGGTLAVAAAISGQTGYKVATDQTNEGIVYTVLTVVAENDVADPPTVVVSVDYEQTVAIAEVDLDVRYTDIPQGTSLQLACTETTFNISKQSISGSGLIGSSGKKLGAFETGIDVRLWIARPEDIVATSALTISMNKIQGGNSGPVKKVLLEKIVLNLSN